MQCVPFSRISSSTRVFKFLKMYSENPFVKSFGWSIREISNWRISKRYSMKYVLKSFFVLSHMVTSNHTHYPIANSVYMNKCSLHIKTQPMLAGASADGRRALSWATDYFLKVHRPPNELFVQVGRGDLDHAFWGRPEDMTMSRPAFRITTSRPGKLASHSFFLTT
jgi:hypothetical protein